MSDFSEFIKEVLLPRMFDEADTIFPSMEFQPYRGGWASPFKLNGERSHEGRKEKSRITEAVPQRVMEQGGESIDLLDFYKEQNGIASNWEAVMELCPILGLRPPQNDPEAMKRYQAFKDKQARLEAISVRMQEALFSDEGRGALSYLEDKRGYSEDFIKRAGFGFASPSLRAELSDIFGTVTDKQGKEKPVLHPSAGVTHLLTFPYRSRGYIYGFVFRSITTDEGGRKYLDAFISEKDSKSAHLYGLMRRKLGSGEEPNITIVEGEIDAMRAAYARVPNVVAASGSNLTAGALEGLRQQGVERITLLFDYDPLPEDPAEAKAKRGEFTAKVKAAIDTIHKAGLFPFVAVFPSPDGRKVDADSFLRHQSGEDLKQIISEAVTGAWWLWSNLYNEALTGKADIGLTDKETLDLKQQVLELATSDPVSTFDRNRILNSFAGLFPNNEITEADIQAEADVMKAAKDEEKQRNAIKKAATEVQRLAKDGKTAEALAKMREASAALQEMNRGAEYDRDLITPSSVEIDAMLRERPKGAKTGYSFKGKNGEQQLELPSGALTLICGQTSHGKSRMLENLTLQLAEDSEPGDVLYFTFEEDVTSVIEELLNIYANIELTGYGNNLRTIREYYTTGSTQFIKGGQQTLSLFLSKAEVFKKLLSDGRIRIFSKYNEGMQLASAIRSFSKQIKIKAVFVDYIQLMRVRGIKTTIRKDELRDVCEILKDLAKETGLPIVLAAQLNRDAKSPVEMSCQNLADASDIEHSANVVMLLWNSSVKPIGSKQYYTDKGERLSDEAKRLADRGFKVGVPGKLYAVLDKNRGGERYIDAILDFNQNTGRIEKNFVEALEPAQQEEERPLWETPF